MLMWSGYENTIRCFQISSVPFSNYCKGHTFCPFKFFHIATQCSTMLSISTFWRFWSYVFPLTTYLTHFQKAIKHHNISLREFFWKKFISPAHFGSNTERNCQGNYLANPNEGLTEHYSYQIKYSAENALNEMLRRVLIVFRFIGKAVNGGTSS